MEDLQCAETLRNEGRIYHFHESVNLHAYQEDDMQRYKAGKASFVYRWWTTGGTYACSRGKGNRGQYITDNMFMNQSDSKKSCYICSNSIDGIIYGYAKLYCFGVNILQCLMIMLFVTDWTVFSKICLIVCILIYGGFNL